MTGVPEDIANRADVSSASELFAFDRRGALLWQARNLGIDGILVHASTIGHIHGSGCWDPPDQDSWLPFVLATHNGVRIDGSAPLPSPDSAG